MSLAHVDSSTDGASSGTQKEAHRVPVLGDLLEADGVADVDEVEDVLLETGAAKADRGVQEFGPDARVGADSVRHLRVGD